MDLSAAAELLGLPVREVLSCDDTPAGLVIVTSDGVSYVLVPEDRPDGAGATGLMYLAAPTDPYNGSFPLYTMPADDDEVSRDGGVMSKADLLARAKELGIEASGKWGEKKLVAAIAEAEAAAGAGQVPDSGDAGDDGADGAVPGREELEQIAVELGIDNAAELDDDELLDAISVARGDDE